MNCLYQGDNLAILREMPDESIDLICTDPPFNTGKDWGAFSDKWEGGLKGYLKFMEARAVEMQRVLKSTGSLYLHCDPTASHYLKVMLDSVFGIKQFRNEIVWQRISNHSDGKQYGRVHDTILFYSKSDKWVWNPVFLPHKPEYIRKFYRMKDARGNYKSSDLTARGITIAGESGQTWRGINPSVNGNHWSAPRRESCPKDIELPKNYESLSVHQKLDALYNVGLIDFPPKGRVPRFKRYLSTSKGRCANDILVDIGVLQSNNKEKTPYPTQKPVALYERMLKASSNQHDIVLDPFAGSGTTLDAAHTLGRQWIGIDSGDEAINVIQGRLRHRHGLEHDRDYELIT